MPFVDQPFCKNNSSSSFPPSSAKLCFKNLVVQTVLGETNLFGRKKRFHTTESSVDGCSVQIIVGIL